MALGRKHLCAQSPGNMDRKWTERSKQLLFPSSPCQGGENKQSLFFSQLLLILGRRQGRECQPQSILTPSILHFLHSKWHPGILSPLSSPGPTLVLLNSTPNRLVSKCIPRDAPRIQGHSLPTPSFHTSPRLDDNNPQTSTLPSAKGGRLCIKGSVLKREYLPMKNQHPPKTKSQRHKLVNKSEQVTRGIGKVPGGLKQSVSLAT